MRPPERVLLITSLYQAFDRFMRIFADVRVPTDVRLDCWRYSNAIMELLYGNHVLNPDEPINGRRKKGEITNASN